MVVANIFSERFAVCKIFSFFIEIWHFEKNWYTSLTTTFTLYGVKFIVRNSLKKSSVSLNLKMLAQLSVLDRQTFNYLVQEIKN